MNNIDDYFSMLEKLQVIPEREVKAICEKVHPCLSRPRKS
jgi:hypothetical protein